MSCTLPSAHGRQVVAEIHARKPAVVFAPSFAPCYTLLKAKLPRPASVSVSARSTLLVSGASVVIEQLELRSFAPIVAQHRW